MNQTQLKRRLNQIADLINALDADLVEQYGEGAHLYFEAEGVIYALKPEPEEHRLRDPTLKQRQERIITDSRWCKFDCGAW
jgi:hypothetical protein